MKALSLYSGGCDGMSLAASWVDIETLAFCEADEACRAVLGNRRPPQQYLVMLAAIAEADRRLIHRDIHGHAEDE